MTTFYPFARHDRADAVAAVDRSGPVTARIFARDIDALAARLPPHRHVVNLCRDRYRFAVALAAALLRGQLTLLPPNDAAGTLADIAGSFADLYAIRDRADHDDPGPASVMPVVAYPGIRDAAGPAAAIPEFPEDRPAVVLFTSGSTGQPTPHMKRWGTLVRSARAAGDALGVARMPGATIVGTVPQQHSYGLESTMMLALQHGLALHHDRPFYPGDVAACIAAVPTPRILVTTPTHLRAMLDDGGELPPVDLVMSATAPLSPQLAAEAERRFAAPLNEIYGCSEAGQLASRRTVEGDAWRPLDGVTLRQDAAGTWASGPSVGREVLLNDVIELAPSGRFHLLGRTADLVNIAGKRTSLAYLNHHLNAIPGVRDGAFIMPDDRTPDDRGEGTVRLMAVVVAPELSAEAIMTALRQRIDPAFLPRPLRLVDALPRNALGKLTREAVAGFADCESEPPA